jgi:putative ABC transport system permease protein
MVEYGLTYADIRWIRATIPGVTVVVPGRILRNYVWNIERKVDCDIVGTVPWYPEMRKHNVAQGRFFSEAETDEQSNVCVLGSGMADVLFPMDSPLGKTVRVGSGYYRVLGVMEPEWESPEGAANGNGNGLNTAARGAQHRMYIPLTAAKSRFGETIIRRRSGSIEAERVELNEATVTVENQDEVLDTSLIIGSMLEQTHKKKDYELIVPLELLRQAERTKRIFNIVLGAIAAISLLVGGIGIMNIMLASVTERTREIGIRRALGAKRRDIVIQFLVETVILSGMGGLIGVALGLAIPFFITLFSEMVTIVTFWSPLIAFSISGLVGVIFGIYPALRAANMDPVEALRHE